MGLIGKDAVPLGHATHLLVYDLVSPSQPRSGGSDAAAPADR
jgi:hypothetical protein